MAEDEVEIRRQTTEEKDKNKEEPGIPYFKIELELTPEQETRCSGYELRDVHQHCHLHGQ